MVILGKTIHLHSKMAYVSNNGGIMLKPLTVARNDYMTEICNLTNNSNLPAFVIVEVLESILREVRPMIDTELKRDMATYRAAMQNEPDKGDNDGR